MMEQLRNQRGMIEAGLAVVLVALVLVGVLVYWRSHHNQVSAPAASTVSKPTAIKTKDPVLDSSANDASSSVNDLNSSFTTDTSNSSLNATQGALQ